MMLVQVRIQNPNHLFEYAIMGTIFAKEMGGISNPKIGVLSMGEEEGKGNEVTEAAAKLLKVSKLNFIGNVEGVIFLPEMLMLLFVMVMLEI